MKSILSKQVWLNMVYPLYFLILLIASLPAQEITKKKNFLYDLNSRWRIEGSGLLGMGINNLQVGITTENEKITISGGGGFGGSFVLGYGFLPQLDLSIGTGIEKSALMPRVKNAKGSFTRIFFLATLKYKKPISSKGLLNFGSGPDFFSPGELDIDASKVSEGGHNIYSYKKATGFHLLAEYEGFINQKFSWIMGLKYYYASYKLESAKLDGIFFPVDNLPADLKKEVTDLNGSGVDLILSFNWYF
jgi:hypothetical protein